MNRSALLRVNTRLTEQVERLEARVGAGRPMRMHNATYERERQRLEDARLRLGGATLSADQRYVHFVDHHVAGERIKLAKRPAAALIGLAEEQLFTGRLLGLINEIFTAGAYQRATNLAKSGLPKEAIADAIMRAVKVRPLVLGMAEEVSDSSERGGLAVTIVEVPFLGDAVWLRVGLEADGVHPRSTGARQDGAGPRSLFSARGKKP